MLKKEIIEELSSKTGISVESSEKLIHYLFVLIGQYLEAELSKKDTDEYN